MSFTADEIQTLNDILDKKLSAQSRDLERAFEQRLEQRIQSLRREFDQRLIATQQEIIRSVGQKLGVQQNGMQSTLHQVLQAHQMGVAQVVSQEIRERLQQQQLERQEQLQQLQQQLERQEEARQQQQQAVSEQPQVGEVIDNALAAQLLAFEELLNQRLMVQDIDDTAMQVTEHSPQFEAIEVQTELPWEDLMDIFGKVLDERFAVLNESTLAAIKNEEQQLTVRLQALQTQQAQLHDELEYYRQHRQSRQDRQFQSYTGDLTNMHEVFQSIEQLERIIESMQVAMTTNHALLSNRLYHHQLLPLERAHPGSSMPTAITTRSDHAAPPNGVGTPLPLAGERREQS
ncbi:MAG TPA: hypothetical protein VKR42_06760 [Ktedonobacteraceae bacterium]|nr:hypothetical protein [Ktedonobacteraceae bacterium]